MPGPGKSLAFWMLASMVLSGCVHPAAPPPVVRIMPSNQFAYNRTALAGTTTTMDFAFDLNPDCSVRSTPTIRVLNPPTNGTVQVVEKEDFPSFQASNVRFACNKNRAKGMAVTYTPNPGFFGSDYLDSKSSAATGPTA